MTLDQTDDHDKAAEVKKQWFLAVVSRIQVAIHVFVSSMYKFQRLTPCLNLQIAKSENRMILTCGQPYQVVS